MRLGDFRILKKAVLRGDVYAFDYVSDRIRLKKCECLKLIKVCSNETLKIKLESMIEFRY